MKIINYDFENIGGLLQVLAVPPSSFLRVRKDYVTNLNYLELRDRDGTHFPSRYMRMDTLFLL